MRELPGARTAILFHCLHVIGSKGHRIVWVNPERRRKIADSEVFMRLIETIHHRRTTTIWSPDEDSTACGDELSDFPYGLSLAVPLDVGETRVGALVLLDLPDKERIFLVTKALEVLSTIVALVFRNALLFENQEEIIEERTRTLKQSEARFRAIFENTSIGMCQWTIDERFTMVNPSLCRMLGYTRKDFFAKTLTGMASKDDLALSHQKKNELLDGESDSLTFEMRFVHQQGHIVWASVGSFLVRDEQGVPSSFITHIQDISHTKKLESQLRQSHKMEAVGTLAGGIAHDFNNILGIIIGNTELAFDDVPDWNPARFNLDEIKIASLRAKDVVRQLLSFSHKTERKRKPIRIDSLIKESTKLLRSSIPTSIEMRLNLPKQICAINAEPTQIHQIIINLCTNAAQAMDQTGGVLGISLAEIVLAQETFSSYHNLAPGHYVQLTVSDTGYGIPSQIRDRVFDPYFTTKEVGKGTGMGLSIVHGIVKSHDGAISLYSEPGKGTTVKVLFPAIEATPVDGRPGSEELPTGKESILFVDDEESITKMGRQMLERLGYTVDTQTNPVSALETFRLNPEQFDLIITDMTMPKMSGDQLAKEALSIREDIPIILCTGFSEKINGEKAHDMGICMYIEKPLYQHDLAIGVRAALDGK